MRPAGEQAAVLETAAPLRAERTPGLRRIGKLTRKYPLASLSLVFLLLCLCLAIFAPLIATANPAAVNGKLVLRTPSAQHWFGTDRLGRDVFSRIVYGSRVSLGVGFAAVVVAGAVGIPLGLVVGYFGGLLDTLVMRATDTFMSIPGLVLALSLILVFSPSFATVAVALGIGAFPGYTRLVRSRVLSLRSADFVGAARTLGANDLRIIVRHILPNTMAPIIVIASLSMGGAVLAEAGLSFLGVGIRPPTPTWGSMLNEYFLLIYTTPWLMLFPGIAIFLLVLSLNLLGDGLRDGLDPRQRGR